MKAAKSNWKRPYYLKLGTMLNKEFQKNKNNIKVGRVFTQKDGIIFKTSVKSNSNISKPVLQGMEIPSDALYYLDIRLTGLVHCLQ